MGEALVLALQSLNYVLKEPLARALKESNWPFSILRLFYAWDFEDDDYDFQTRISLLLRKFKNLTYDARAPIKIYEI